MIEMESGASDMSTVQRDTRCAPESYHSIVARASPGQGGPSGGLASRVHSPTSGSSRFSASSAVGWSIASPLPLVGGCGHWQLDTKLSSACPLRRCRPPLPYHRYPRSGPGLCGVWASEKHLLSDRRPCSVQTKSVRLFKEPGCLYSPGFREGIFSATSFRHPG